MKNILPRLLTFTCIIAFVLGTTSLALAGERGEPQKGSTQLNAKTSPLDLPGLAKINFQQALDAALAKAPGAVIKAELEVENNILMYSFEIVGANKTLTEVEIDAGTGAVLGADDETAEAKSASGTAAKPVEND
jgi:hypothetical protein